MIALFVLIICGLNADSSVATMLREGLSQRYGATINTLADANATKASIQQSIDRIAQQSKAGDKVMVVMLGYGSEGRFNIPGPDITAAELNVLLATLKDRQVSVVAATAGSGAFMQDLSAPGRVVITATRNAAENETVTFGEHFARAFKEDVADTDKDGVLSIEEAFLYAKREVARGYQQQNRLATEHALVNDSTAATKFILGAKTAVANDARARLETQIAELKTRKSEMKAEEYDAALEKLLLQLAALRKSQ